MSHQDWVNMFAPMAGDAIKLAGLILLAIVTGAFSWIKAWLTAHGQATAAQAVAAASLALQPAITTGAATVAGKIARGELDYTNRSAWMVEIMREVDLVQSRLPQMWSTAAPVILDVAASMAGKVDAMLVASPTPLAGQVATAAPSISDAAKTISQARADLAAVYTPPQPAAASAQPAAALVPQAAFPNPVS